MNISLEKSWVLFQWNTLLLFAHRSRASKLHSCLPAELMLTEFGSSIVLNQTQDLKDKAKLFNQENQFCWDTSQLVFILVLILNSRSRMILAPKMKFTVTIMLLKINHRISLLKLMVDWLLMFQQSTSKAKTVSLFKLLQMLVMQDQLRTWQSLKSAIWSKILKPKFSLDHPSDWEA